jgi:ADP-ribosyl-[dinitrogen reductase] hydrolase
VTDQAVTDRQRGSLLGLAIGDALGAAVEFRPRGSFPPVTGYRAGGPHGLQPGEWTDDTSMALALADSIASAGWDLNDQAEHYMRWWRGGEFSVNGQCFDIGITTRAALARFQQTGDARTSGDSSERASGNGSIMRLAPVPIAYAGLFPGRLDELARLAAESSLPTHASPQCLSACRYFALVLAGLMDGVPRETVLAPDWGPLGELRRLEPLHPAVDEVAQGSFRRRHPPEIEGSGYVVKSLEAALWAFHDAADFREAVLRAVNLGDDADTTGAVCGQLAGAFWGESGIPQEWLSGLAKREMIENALAGLLRQKPATAEQPPLPKIPSVPMRNFFLWL